MDSPSLGFRPLLPCRKGEGTWYETSVPQLGEREEHRMKPLHHAGGKGGTWYETSVDLPQLEEREEHGMKPLYHSWGEKGRNMV